MKFHDFIFSEKILIRLSRHICFWSLVFVFYVLLTGSVYIAELTFENPFTVQDLLRDLYLNDFSRRLDKTAIDLIPVIIYCYLTAYWLLPKYLIKKKYLAFWSWLITLTLIGEVIKLYQYGLNLQTPIDEALTMLWIAAITLVNLGSPILCGLFITIKMVKVWYVKEAEKLTLIRENANAELQLLKAQIHPHFLFNTLNNIYSFSLNQSAKAPELVSKLSDVLNYMINDCEASLVPIEKEIKLLEDYIGLEKVRYGNRLNLEININGNPQNRFVAPLLMIPLVENSFKHGTSKMLTDSWIRLTIDFHADTLHFRLSNSKPIHNPKTNGKNGIGLTNVKKRLQLLYPDQHTLLLESRDETFTVEMNLPLHKSLDPIEPIKKASIQTPAVV